MGRANGLISSGTSGVSFEDIRQVVGIDDYDDIRGLIVAGVSRGLINKWAKYKPIHFPDKYELTDAEFRGRSIDTNDKGVVYGLKVPSQISVIDPSAFHGTTWEYLGYPNAPGLSGASPYRTTDFDGYYTNALPDIYGLIPSTSKFYVGTDDGGIVTANSVVNEGYRVNNQYGVPLARYVVDGVALSYDDFMGRLAKCYPAILIGNYLTGVGVYNSQTQGVDYETIVKYNGGWVVHSDSWCVDMRKTDENGNRPWTADTDTVATLVLVYTGRSDDRLIATDQDSLLTQYWFDMTEERLWTARIFPLPGACGVPIQVKRYITPGFTLTPVSATGTTSSVTITFAVSYVGSETSPMGSASITARVGSGGLEPTTTVFLRGTGNASATFTAQQFDKQMFDPQRDTSIFVRATANPGAETSDTLTITY